MRTLLVTILFTCFLSFSNQLKAQGYIQDVSGRPIAERNLSDIGGSPYFKDEFLKGSIIMEDKSVFSGLFLRYDQEADQLVYRKPNSSTSMVTNGRVSEFVIEVPNASPVKFKSVVKNNPEMEGFYQVLAEGKFSLLKKTKRKMVEKVEYNSTTKTKSMITQNNYFLLNPDGQLIAVKPDKKSLVKALGANEVSINDYVKSESINFKSDSDLAKLITHYNLSVK